MFMEIIFLGTGSMIPTKERNHSAALLCYKGENILIDCGEGTQRQLRMANITPTKITKILISHWHGDHILGLPGLIQTLDKHHYNKTLEIYGPKGTKKYFDNLFKGFSYKIGIKYKIIEIIKQKFFEDDDFYLESLKLNHSIPCIGFCFIEKDIRKVNMKYLKKFKLKSHPIIRNLQKGKDITWEGKKIKYKLATKLKEGKKISFITDTAYCDNAIKLSKDVDLAILEATFSHELEDKAQKYKHLTAKQAALIAKKAKAKKLILNHFSQRYRDISLLKKEAKKVFNNVETSEDFLTISL